MLENFLRPKIDEYGEEHNLEDFWFQQDGAMKEVDGLSFILIDLNVPVLAPHLI
jgi:hypothetical protein